MRRFLDNLDMLIRGGGEEFGLDKMMLKFISGAFYDLVAIMERDEAQGATDERRKSVGLPANDKQG